MVAAVEIVQRFWEDILVRPSGPLALRFLLQPVVSTVLAARDGIKDARNGRSPYFWTVLNNSTERAARLREGLAATGKVVVLALALDTAYQIIKLKNFYPFEAVTIAIVLGFLPYLLIRGPAARLAGRWSRENDQTK